MFALHVSLEGVDVNVEYGKTFDFASVKTWAWSPKGAGDVIIARSKDDDPAAVKRKAEPLILDAVAGELMRKGLQQAASAPDVTVTPQITVEKSDTTVVVDTQPVADAIKEAAETLKRPSKLKVERGPDGQITELTPEE